MIGPTCPKCGWIHVPGEVVRLARFSATMPAYRIPGGAIFSTREAAEAALCADRVARQAR